MVSWAWGALPTSPRLCHRTRTVTSLSFLLPLIHGFLFCAHFWSQSASSHLIWTVSDVLVWICLPPPTIPHSPALLVKLVSVLLLYVPLSSPVPIPHNLLPVFPLQSGFLHQVLVSSHLPTVPCSIRLHAQLSPSLSHLLLTQQFWSSLPLVSVLSLLYYIWQLYIFYLPPCCFASSAALFLSPVLAFAPSACTPLNRPPELMEKLISPVSNCVFRNRIHLESEQKAKHMTMLTK